jgi:hypothetical protein
MHQWIAYVRKECNCLQKCEMLFKNGALITAGLVWNAIRLYLSAMFVPGVHRHNQAHELLPKPN